MVVDTIPLVPEQLLWGEDHPMWAIYPDNDRPSFEKGYKLDISKDSYIIGFCGPRGSGKTLAMTTFAVKAMVAFGMKVVSNYPIQIKVKDRHGKVKPYSSEPLDLYKLMVFDHSYGNSLILIDEAPLFISHLSSMSWRNRLLDIFIQQIRKSGSSLFYASQNQKWVDIQWRWQTDVLFYCQDASKRYGQAHLKRGETILLDALDMSGMWTGRPYSVTKRSYPFKLRGRYVWGAFDTFYQMDVFESLKKVDMRLSSYKIDQRNGDHDDIALKAAVKDAVNGLVNTGTAVISRAGFMDSLGDLDAHQKRVVTSELTKIGAKRLQRDSSGAYRYDFSEINIEKT